MQTGVFAVHIFGAQNLYLDANFPPEHYGIYVQITVGSTTKCTSLQSPFKKGRIVWDEIRNFPVTVSQEFRKAYFNLPVEMIKTELYFQGFIFAVCSDMVC